MASYCLLAFALFGCTLADSSVYKAPSQGYGAPQQSGHGSPTAPAYEPQPFYGASAYEQTGYEVQDKSTDIFNLDNLIKLVFPFLIVVYLALVAVHWVLAPAMATLFNAMVGRSNDAREVSGFLSSPETLEALTNFAHNAFQRKLLYPSCLDAKWTLFDQKRILDLVKMEFLLPSFIYIKLV